MKILLRRGQYVVVKRRERNEHDDYPTPQWPTHRLLEALQHYAIDPESNWLEPCAGNGGIIRAVRSFKHWPSLRPKWYGIEPQKHHFEKLQKRTVKAWNGPVQAVTKSIDFNTTVKGFRKRNFEVAISNPPFRIAEKVIRAVRPHAWYVVMLLRVGFLATEERERFYKDLGMPDVWVLPNRPSFIEEGGTDSQEYAWLVWPPASHAPNSRVSTIKRLAVTPLSERGKT